MSLITNVKAQAVSGRTKHGSDPAAVDSMPPRAARQAMKAGNDGMASQSSGAYFTTTRVPVLRANQSAEASVSARPVLAPSASVSSFLLA